MLSDSVQPAELESDTLPSLAMKTSEKRVVTALAADGNREERSAQVQRILDRLGRLQREHDEVSAEVKQLTDDIEKHPDLYGPATKQPD